MFGFLKKSPVIRLPSRTGTSEGTVALSYLTAPFRTPGSHTAWGHTNWGECRAMAQAWCDAGFQVEVVDHKDRKYRPSPHTTVAIDIHHNLERWEPTLDSSCKKILHATGAHWLTQNAAELIRLENLKNRREVALLPQRQSAPNRGPETADAITILGNAFTAESFHYANKPVERIPISSAYSFSWRTDRNWEEARRRFLWVGSFGMVHKGLDLLLEAFASMPDFQLTVCGRPEKEPDFWRAYEKELTQTPNIRLEGWMDLNSPRFEEIRSTHGQIISASCSEGGGGAVIHGMHAGLLPVVTRETSVDVGNFGQLIEHGTVDDVRRAVSLCAQADPGTMESRAHAAWEYARTHHTLEAFTESYRAFCHRLLA